MNEIARIVLDSAEGAFLQVGVFVGALLLVFGYLNYRTAGGFIVAIARNKRFQVPIGAALGVSPGCGGAIFVMPLYIRGVVTFGTVVATLISTMGDSSFVIIAKAPKQAVYIHLISLIVGIISGYVIDALGIGKRWQHLRQEPTGRPSRKPVPSAYAHLGHDAGDQVGEILHLEGWEVADAIGYRITHRGYGIYWLILAVGFILGTILLFQQDISCYLGFDANRLVGLAGTGISVVWFLASRHTVADDTHSELEEKTASIKEMFIHNAHETAFVTFWVLLAYSAYELSMHFTHLDLAAIVARAGVLPIIATACIGLIPGCGPQIVTVTLYTQGVIPFSALVSHTISQDGDALFPLLAMNHRAALLATVITTIPAIIVGVVLYYLGF